MALDPIMPTDVPASQPIEVTFEPTFSEFLRIRFTALFRVLRGIFILSAIVPPAMFLAFGLAEGAMTWKQLSVPIGWLVLVFVVLPLALYVETRRGWSKMAELRGTRSYVFSDAGIEIKSKLFSGQVAWELIKKAERLGPLLTLQTAQMMYYYVPVGAFASADQIQHFRELVRKHVKDCKI